MTKNILICFDTEYSVCDSLVVQCRSKILSPRGKVFVDELEEIRLCGFALVCDRLAKASRFVFNAKSSNCISEVLLPFSLLWLQSLTN